MKYDENWVHLGKLPIQILHQNNQLMMMNKMMMLMNKMIMMMTYERYPQGKEDMQLPD